MKDSRYLPPDAAGKGEEHMKKDLKRQIITALAVTAMLGAAGGMTAQAVTPGASVTPVGAAQSTVATTENPEVSAAAGKTDITLDKTPETAATVYGGGKAEAYTADRVQNPSPVYKATLTTAGSEINVNADITVPKENKTLLQHFSVYGGGRAEAANWASASSDMTDTVNVNINANVSGMVVGNGLAYFYGIANKPLPETGTYGLAGVASVSAVNTNINMQSGSAAGLIGGGVALDDSQADITNAKAETKGTATINVTGGTVNTLNVEDAESSTHDKNNVDPANGTYTDGIKAAAGNAAIAAGGIALGGGADAYVANAEVNINGGTVNGDIYAGGIAAYGYSVTEEGAQSGTKPVGGSHVETSTINLNGGTVTGNVYAGGAAATKNSDGSDVYSTYNQAVSTVGTAVINLAGAKVDGILYGVGTVDAGVKENTSIIKADDSVNSTLNVIGTNTLKINGDDTSKIQSFDAVKFKAGSETVLDASFTTGKHLIDGGQVTVENGARLNINQLDKTTTNAYQIAVNTANGSKFWTDDNLVYDRTSGYYATGNDKEDGTEFSVTYSKINTENTDQVNKAADSMANALGARSLLGMFREGMGSNWEGFGAAKNYLQDWSKAEDPTAGQKGMLIGEDAAVTGNTVSIARAMADNVTQRLSFTDDYVQEPGSAMQDGGVWAKYMHRKYETDGMGSSMGGIHSSTDYDGVLVGMDFAKSGKFQSGVAIHYGSGEGDGLISHNDYDAWGITLYGSLKDEEAGTNLMADIGWMTSDNDIDGTVNGKRMSADRDVDTWTIGIRGEKEFVSGKNQIVPYAGLRYMSVNPGSYTTYYDGQAAFHNDAENQDLWLLPIGVSFRNETATSSGWKITPKLDLSYIWAFGDTDTDMTVTVNAGNASSTLYYDVMDDSSWLATLGVEAEKDAWTFGINYGYQKGDDTKNKTWYVTAGYSF